MTIFLKYSLLCFMCFLGVDALAQSTVREELEKRIEEKNKALPFSAMQGIVFKKTYISDYSIYEIHEIDEKYFSWPLLKHNKGAMKKNLLKEYGENPHIISLILMMIECNMDMVIQYVSKQSGESFQIVLKTNELAKCIE